MGSYYYDKFVNDVAKEVSYELGKSKNSCGYSDAQIKNLEWSIRSNEIYWALRDRFFECSPSKDFSKERDRLLSELFETRKQKKNDKSLKTAILMHKVYATLAKVLAILSLFCIIFVRNLCIYPLAATGIITLCWICSIPNDKYKEREAELKYQLFNLLPIEYFCKYDDDEVRCVFKSYVEKLCKRI